MVIDPHRCGTAWHNWAWLGLLLAGCGASVDVDGGDAAHGDPAAIPGRCILDEPGTQRRELVVGEESEADQWGCNTCICTQSGALDCTNNYVWPGCVGCFIAEHEYEDGEMIEAPDSCNTCTCNGSYESSWTCSKREECGVTCTSYTDGLSYAPGDVTLDNDPPCTCLESGEWLCM